MEPIQVNDSSKLIDIEKINQIPLNNTIQDSSKFNGLSINELKNLLNQKLETLELLKAKSLIKDKVLCEFKSKVEAGEVVVNKDNYRNYPPCILEEKKVAYSLSSSGSGSESGSGSGSGNVVAPKKINSISATLSSDFNVFNERHSTNIYSEPENKTSGSGEIINASGKKDLAIKVDQSNIIIIGKSKNYNIFDWIALYDHQNTSDSIDNYIKFWWAGNYDAEINTSITRDKNRSYFVKYFKYDSGKGKFEVIDECALSSENVWIKLQGGSDEKLKLTWSNSDSASSTSYVSIYSKPSFEPSNIYITNLFHNANKDKGIYSTQIKNDGSTFYAVLWGYIDNYFIKLATDKIN